MTHSTKLTSLATGETIATVDTVDLVKVQKVLGGYAETYHVLELVKAELADLEAAAVPDALVQALTDALGDRPRLLVGYQTPKPDAPWTITGTILDRAEEPLPGLQVLAHDKDTAKRDDFLGCAFTDKEGFFELHYSEADFKSEKALIDFEGNPDIYLHLTDLERGVTKRTATKGEAKKEEYFEIKVDFDSPTKMLRPIVGYYYIEEDKLEDEVEELKDAIKRSPDDPQSHFLLGLCLLEMMKSDLRKAEWMIPELRSDDDILAMAAIQEFDEVAALDPEREEEAKRYRRYVEELQNLAL